MVADTGAIAASVSLDDDDEEGLPFLLDVSFSISEKKKIFRIRKIRIPKE